LQADSVGKEQIVAYVNFPFPNSLEMIKRNYEKATA
jgi:hypothetical protein